MLAWMQQQGSVLLQSAKIRNTLTNNPLHQVE
jgi:hypothetical protein